VESKMKGVVAQLVTTDATGKRLESKLVFRPYCHVYLKDLHDDLAETEFGEEIAERVLNSQIVEVTREVPEYAEVRSCPVEENRGFIRTTFCRNNRIVDDLMSLSTAKKLGYASTK